jgi:hypothetical protein
MSDCDLAISNAVEAAYSDLWDQAPKHYWCLFHVMKAFKENAKSHLKDRADEALTDFRGVVYSQTDMTELRLELFCGKWNRISPSFVDYVRRQWDNRAERWGLFYRTVRGFWLELCPHPDTDTCLFADGPSGYSHQQLC